MRRPVGGCGGSPPSVFGGIRLVGIGEALLGDPHIASHPFPRVGRPFHPNPHPPQRLLGSAASSSSGVGGLVSVALPGVSPDASRRHASPIWGRNFLGSSPRPAPPLPPNDVGGILLINPFFSSGRVWFEGAVDCLGAPFERWVSSSALGFSRFQASPRSPLHRDVHVRGARL